MLQGFAAMAGGYLGTLTGLSIGSLLLRNSLPRPDLTELAVAALVILTAITCGTVGFMIGWRRIVMDGYDRWLANRESRNASPGRSTAK